MKAMIITGINEYGMHEDLEVPKIGPNEVLLHSRASGICHSDYELIEGKYIIPFTYPIIPGHEWAADVVEIGENVTNVKVGDRVVGECAIGCGLCLVCQNGDSAFCPNSNHFGFTQDGANAEYFKANAEWLHVLPDDVDYLAGSLIEPFSVAYKGIYDLGSVDAADVCVVVGGGTIGCCAVAVSHAMGAFTIAVEPEGFKRDVCKELGADVVIDPTTQDVAEEVKKYTKGFGADMVVECAGHDAALASTFDLAKNGGRISFVGINIGKIIPAELGKIQAKGLRIQGSVGSPNVWERCIQFISKKKIDLSPIQTHTFRLDEAVEAFKFNLDPKNSTIKVTLLND